MESIFVPFSLDKEPLIPILSESEIVSLTNHSDYQIIAFYLNNETRFYQFIEHMVNQGCALHPNYTFVRINEELPQFFKPYLQISPHVVAIYKEGAIKNIFPLPDHPDSFFPMLDHLIDPRGEIFKSKIELFEYLGNFDYTLITTNEYFSQAQEIQANASQDMGYIDIVLVENDVILSLTNSTIFNFALFRKEDSYIQPLNGSIEHLFESSYPIYRLLRMEDLSDSSMPTLVFISPQLTSEQIDFLISISQLHSDFIVGWASNSIVDGIKDFVPLHSTEVDIALLHLEPHYYYNMSSVFSPSFLTQPFNPELWISKLNSIIESIHKGLLEANYLSEPEPPINTTIQKLVGTTYSSFIHKDNSESLVFYMNPTCPHCSDFFPIFESIAKEYHQNSLTKIQFGYIDISSNSVKGDFPPMIGVPHLRFFTESGINNTTLYCPHNKIEIIRSLNIISQSKLSIELPPISKSELTSHLYSLMLGSSSLNDPSEQEALKSYMDEQLAIIRSISDEEILTTNDQKEQNNNEL